MRRTRERRLRLLPHRQSRRAQPAALTGPASASTPYRRRPGRTAGRPVTAQRQHPGHEHARHNPRRQPRRHTPRRGPPRRCAHRPVRIGRPRRGHRHQRLRLPGRLRPRSVPGRPRHTPGARTGNSTAATTPGIGATAGSPPTPHRRTPPPAAADLDVANPHTRPAPRPDSLRAGRPAARLSRLRTPSAGRPACGSATPAPPSGARPAPPPAADNSRRPPAQPCSPPTTDAAGSSTLSSSPRTGRTPLPLSGRRPSNPEPQKPGHLRNAAR